MGFRNYYKLKNSILDASVPENWIKLKIDSYTKNKYSNKESICAYFCSNGGCDLPQRPCENYTCCPYSKCKELIRPRKNSRDYDNYCKEFKLQKTQHHLQVVNDEKIEKYLNGELLPHEYMPLVNLISDHITEYEMQDVYYDDIFRDIRMALKIRKNNVERAIKNSERIIYDINEYFYIKMDNLPDFRIDGKSVWYHLTYSYGWIKRENFSEDVWTVIKNNKRSSYNRQYFMDLEILENQLEEYYGLMTMFKLLDDLQS